MKRAAAVVVCCLSITSAVATSTPPLVNYQGVLRNGADAPLSGTFDMVFRFYGSAVGSNDIFVDTHTVASGAPVVVTGGLFNVQLGGGTLSDGAGPGVYTSLSDVF